jgi:hypothetical protein
MAAEDPHEVPLEYWCEIWNKSPLDTFAWFRDCCLIVMETVAQVHHAADRAERTVSIASILAPMRERFAQALPTAQNLWWQTPLSHFVTRTSPVIVIEHGPLRSRYDGACFHEVALNFGDALHGGADVGIAGDYAATLRYYTARGDFVNGYLRSLLAEIRCESHEGMRKFQLANGPGFVGLLSSRDALPRTDASVIRPEASPQLAIAPVLDEAPTPFTGGELTFFSDRVELCGVDICSGPRSGQTRRLLELLAERTKAGDFVAYGGKKLAAKLTSAGGAKGVAGMVRDVRAQITRALLEGKNIQCGLDDVILSGGVGYRFTSRLSVHVVKDETPVSRDEGDPQTDDRPASNVHDPQGADVHDVHDNPTTNVHDVHDQPPVNVHDVHDQIESSAPCSSDTDAAVSDVGDPTNSGDYSSGSVVNVRERWVLDQMAQGTKVNARTIAQHFDCNAKTAHRLLATDNKSTPADFLLRLFEFWDVARRRENIRKFDKMLE